MKGLSQNIQHLQKLLERQKDRDVEFRTCVNAALVGIFGHTGHIKEISQHNNRIRLVANNKAAAQELFLHQEEILAKLRQHSAYQAHTLTVQ